MKSSYSDVRYPVEYLKFKCRNEEEARQYLKMNQIWTTALAKKKGFISTTSYLNNSNPGEVHIVIIWETLDEWLSIDKEELIKIDKDFKAAFMLPFDSLERLHIETNFGLHKVRHDEKVGNQL